MEVPEGQIRYQAITVEDAMYLLGFGPPTGKYTEDVLAQFVTPKCSKKDNQSTSLPFVDQKAEEPRI